MTPNSSLSRAPVLLIDHLRLDGEELISIVNDVRFGSLKAPTAANIDLFDVVAAGEPDAVLFKSIFRGQDDPRRHFEEPAGRFDARIVVDRRGIPFDPDDPGIA